MKQEQVIAYTLHSIIALVIYLISILFKATIYIEKINYIILVFMVLQIIYNVQFLKKRRDNKLLAVLGIVATIVIYIIVQGKGSIIEGLLLLGMQGILINFLEMKELDRESYIKIAAITFFILLFSTIFHLRKSREFLTTVNWIYILVIILLISLLKMVRNYTNNINGKNEIIKLVGTCLLIISIFIYIGSLTVEREKIKVKGQKPQVIEDTIVREQNYQEEEHLRQKYLKLGNTFKVICIIIIISSIGTGIYYLIVKNKSEKIASNDKEEDEDEIIIREKLDNVIKKKTNLMYKVYTGKDNRTVVKKLFYDVIYRLNRKALYNKSHTATEVILRLNNDHSQLRDINRIYNKAKFSNIPITDMEVQLAKLQYDKIKKDIKMKR